MNDRQKVEEWRAFAHKQERRAVAAEAERDEARAELVDAKNRANVATAMLGEAKRACDEARAQLAEPVALLRDLEWSARVLRERGIACCPVCGGVCTDEELDEHAESWISALKRAKGHSADCRLSVLLGERDARYECEECGKPRTEAQGGRVFTVCDSCWNVKREAREADQ